MYLVSFEQRNSLLQSLADHPSVRATGGSGPNTVTAMALLGAKAAFAGKVGLDADGEFFAKSFAEANVISFLKNSDESATGTSIILITPDSERTMSTYLGNCQNFSEQELTPESVANARILYFTGYMWDTASQKRAARKALCLARDHGRIIAFDVADSFAVKRYREDFLELIHDFVDILFANEAEAKMLVNCTDLPSALTQMQQLVPLGALKQGERGSAVFDRAQIIPITPTRVSAIDTTGAGDMYAAGFLLGVLRGYALARCGELASYTAAQVVSHIGARINHQDRAAIAEKMN
jgi:sugar/nucleoside kinase (ribokinase family)